MRRGGGSGKVVEVDFSGVRLRVRRGSECRHRNVEVDEGAREVFCSSCGARLDAIRVLLEYAEHEREFVSAGQVLGGRREELRREIEDLTKERDGLELEIGKLLKKRGRIVNEKKGYVPAHKKKKGKEGG